MNDRVNASDSVGVELVKTEPAPPLDPYESLLRTIANRFDLDLDFVRNILPCFCLVASCKGEMQIDRVEDGHVIYAGCGCGNEQRTPIPG